MLELLGLPRQASTHAAEIDNMIVLVHWLMLVLFVGWGAFFAFVLFRFRKGANPRASYVGAHGKIAKSTEVGVAIVEVILLLFYAIPAWAVRVRAFPAENEAVVVRIVAEQFAWNVHYAGPDGKFGRRDIKLITSDNPLGLDRTDPDAKDDITDIHSFGLVEMRVKQDAVPGMDIPVWFVPNKIGEYEIACSQLCGLGHFRMRGFVHVKSDADYRSWMADQVKALP